MILLLHVLIALSSLVFTGAVYFRPSKKGLHLSGVLVGGTLISGTILTIASHASLVSACFSGLAYLSVVSLMILASGRKLAKQHTLVD